MKFSDLFIKKPVLAIVVALLILVLGLRSVTDLTVRQYPKTENAVVTVTTTYYGADAQTVAGFITQPLEAAIAQAQGIDYLSSSSTTGASVITATLQLNYDSNRALTEIQTQISSVSNQLPPQAQQPVITVQVGQSTASMYIGFYSDTLPSNNITDYVVRVVKPRLDAIDGVQTAELLGGRQFALRAWLDPVRLAAHGVTAADVYAAMSANNYLTAVGATKGQTVTVALTAATDLHSVGEFRKLVVKQKDGALVRLEDVANVVLGAEDYDSAVAFDGNQSVFLGIKTSPDANILDVAERVRNAFPEIRAQLPAGITGQIAYDATDFINTSIEEVVKTLIEALVIVTLVIFLFMGSFRAVIIPVIAMPLSLIGAFFVMLLLGYTINLITLLALVLAIGLVVDDAIIVVENIDRHIKEEGKTPFQAAIVAARELTGPIIAMTIVLVAVYVPIGFQGGLTGALFTEFAFTLAGAVTVSAIIALALSPMLGSRFLRSEHGGNRFVDFIDRRFDRLHAGYERRLKNSLRTWVVPVVMGLILLAVTPLLFMTSKAELAPEEDQGIVLGMATAAPNASPAQVHEYLGDMHTIAKTVPEVQQTFQFTGFSGPNSVFTGAKLKPWSERSRNANAIQQELQQKWAGIAGVNTAAFQFPPLPGASGLPVEVVMSTTEPFENLYEVAQAVLERLQSSGKFWFVDMNLKLDKPQSTVEVDRDMIAALGMTQQDVGSALGSALGGGYVNYFSIAGRSYKVIPQVLQQDRLNPDQVLDNYIRTPSGAVIPASTVATIRNQVVPQSLTRFQQLNSVTFSGVASSQGEAIGFVRDTIQELAPTGYNVDYSGQARQFMTESGGFALTLLFAVIIVYLALAAQFNSLRDPIVILVSVPMALFGALVFINVLPTIVSNQWISTRWSTSINIYTQVGLVTLMGLISKHGILIVEFANELQRAGKTKLEAIVQAAATRLRPILMTTAAMVLGVVPLVIASGAGAAGRFNMGLVIATGLTIGTLFTLFVVPAFYMLLAEDHHGEAKKRLEDAGSDAVPA
ncbi:MAG TPA: efflux RND transporter permease subunit [Dokdonella sp.]|uniref:efflux RND transporter permease subunit n=1 Tax=Dokdonella sp. TaxID=2291710 RepID=UPI0025C335E6|nr:efflux RND transporter permease subunit [Dokdonella sp.]MBX3691233.1 efflux RND transporter permease subunit [Dokdonella sp.]MCW5567620.1 efflux RND transporter permease subunit [Dokdonella sp.]HNR91653.1 efflux RND transporter permease subunit [Dokdonella sp.]